MIALRRPFVLAICTGLIIVAGCGDDEDIDDNDPDAPGCTANADCDDGDVCADGTCTDDAPVSGAECAQDDEFVDVADLICVDERWTPTADLPGPTIEALTADPEHVERGGTIDVVAEISHPLDADLILEWNVDAPDWALVDDDASIAAEAPDIPDAEATITLDVSDEWGGTDSASVIVRTDPLECDPENTPFGAGEGSDDIPWLICSARQLVAISDDLGVGDDTFELTADIDLDDLDEAFAPISGFRGTLFGNGHSIENLTIDAPGGGSLGLFSGIGVGAHIDDLVLEDVDITGMSNVGALAANLNHSFDPDTPHAKISNIRVTGVIRGEQAAIGGIIGINGGTIEDVEVDVAVHGGHTVGGIAGRNAEGATITDAEATMTAQGQYRIGGIVGENNGDVLRSRADVAIDAPAGQSGGLVGYHGDGATVAESHATGKLEGPQRLGGLVGASADGSSIVDSRASAELREVGDATGEITSHIGGAVGSLGGELRRSYATGAIDVPPESDEAGGLVGARDGQPGDPGVVDASFWDTDTSEIDVSDGGQGLTTDAFGDDSLFEGWDFDDVWTMGEDESGDERPVLRWE